MENITGTRLPLEPIGYDGPRVRLCEDGKYRWKYEFNMLKNPAIILVVYKIFGILFSIPFLINVISLAAAGKPIRGEDVTK